MGMVLAMVTIMVAVVVVATIQINLSQCFYILKKC